MGRESAHQKDGGGCATPRALRRFHMRPSLARVSMGSVIGQELKKATSLVATSLSEDELLQSSVLVVTGECPPGY